MTDPMLNQMIAVKKGLTARTAVAIDKIYKDLQKPALTSGLSRTYTPKAEDGEKIPPEYTQAQQDAETKLADIAELWTKLFDVVLTVDEGNTVARGSVVVDGRELLYAPVPFLLYAEKQLIDFRTIVSKLPTLDPAVRWEPNEHGDAKWRSIAESTNRTKKVLKNHVKAEATDKHPAQVEVFSEDVTVGTWTLVKFSGAVPSKERDALLQRINDVIDAVRRAVEQANATQISQKTVGAELFAYLLG